MLQSWYQAVTKDEKTARNVLEELFRKANDTVLDLKTRQSHPNSFFPMPPSNSIEVELFIKLNSSDCEEILRFLESKTALTNTFI